MQIGSKQIGYDQPCYIIAEGCDNHLGNLETAKQMALQAKLAGADAIKFQHHLPDEEMLPDAPMSSNFQEPLYEFLKKHALSLEQHRELMAYCRQEPPHHHEPQGDDDEGDTIVGSPLGTWRNGSQPVAEDERHHDGEVGGVKEVPRAVTEQVFGEDAPDWRDDKHAPIVALEQEADA